MSIQIVRKITVKGIAGKVDIEKVLAAEGKTLVLARIIGIARKAFPDSSALGEFVRFSGTFKGVNCETGEEFHAGTCILPGVAQDMLYGAFDSEGKGEVSFGFDIVVTYDAGAISKYTYSVIPLLAPAENDPLSMLSKEIANRQALLASPKEPEADPDVKPAKTGKK